jgi:hypothetical protein
LSVLKILFNNRRNRIQIEKGGLSMRLMDGMLLTLISTVICVAFPKLLSMVLIVKTKRTAQPQTISTPQEVGTELPIFPY